MLAWFCVVFECLCELWFVLGSGCVVLSRACLFLFCICSLACGVQSAEQLRTSGTTTAGIPPRNIQAVEVSTWHQGFGS